MGLGRSLLLPRSMSWLVNSWNKGLYCMIYPSYWAERHGASTCVKHIMSRGHPQGKQNDRRYYVRLIVHHMFSIVLLQEWRMWNFCAHEHRAKFLGTVQWEGGTRRMKERWWNKFEGIRKCRGSKIHAYVCHVVLGPTRLGLYWDIYEVEQQFCQS